MAFFSPNFNQQNKRCLVDVLQPPHKLYNFICSSKAEQRNEQEEDVFKTGKIEM